MNNAEELCIRIYMAHHVSEFNEMENTESTRELRAVWNEGQRLYSNKLNPISNEHPDI